MKKTALFLIAALLLNGCLGMKTDIELSKNGSGKISVEFSVSKEALSMADNFGQSGGSDEKPVIPMGREDFERGIEGIAGLKMTSFSTKEDDVNKIFFIKMSFTNIDALLAYLQTQNGVASFKKDGNKSVLTFSFSADEQPVDPQIKGIVPFLFAGYYMDFGITLPEKCDVVCFDANGLKIDKPQVGEISVNNKTAQFKVPMGDLISSATPVKMQITW
ncbi:hypothetical protein AGMMS50212_04630 [Spirochaetia bacterium]|nr:hypothetical protein AGMMS50212_04630 [Spirochaetia bacterium]